VGNPESRDAQRFIDASRRKAFKQLARRYADDARADFRRSAWYAVVASVVGIASASWGAFVITDGDSGLASGVAIGALFLGASAPIWWEADRCRRSGLENRRLQRHAITLEPFLAGFEGDERAIVRTALAQVFFARTYEDADPLRALSWPEGAASVGARSGSPAAATDDEPQLVETTTAVEHASLASPESQPQGTSTA
jgi:hypothetical protein